MNDEDIDIDLSAYGFADALRIMDDYPRPHEQMSVVQCIVCNVILNLPIDDKYRVEVVDLLAQRCRSILDSAVKVRALDKMQTGAMN